MHAWLALAVMMAGILGGAGPGGGQRSASIYLHEGRFTTQSIKQEIFS